MRPLPFFRQLTANHRFTDNRLSRARARVDVRSLRLPQRIIIDFVQALVGYQSHGGPYGTIGFAGTQTNWTQVLSERPGIPATGNFA